MEKKTKKRIGSPSSPIDFDPKKSIRKIRRLLSRHDNNPEYILLQFAHEPVRITCCIAMGDIEKYLKAARLQIRRLEGCRRSIARLFEEDRKARKLGDFMPKIRRPSSRPFTEIHFYFICWDAIHSRINLLHKKSGFKPISLVHKTHLAELKRYSDARNHLEHYTERLPGGSRKLQVPGDLGNLWGNQYSLGGERWDVSRKGLRRLEIIVGELRKAIRASRPNLTGK